VQNGPGAVWTSAEAAEEWWPRLRERSLVEPGRMPYGLLLLLLLCLFLFVFYLFPSAPRRDFHRCAGVYFSFPVCFVYRFPLVVVVFELQNNYEDDDDGDNNGFDIIIILHFREYIALNRLEYIKQHNIYTVNPVPTCYNKLLYRIIL